MEADFDLVVERVLILKDSTTNQQQEVKVRIGRPYWTDPGLEAACPVAVDGLIERRNDMYGIDPLHAMEMAIAYAKSFLKHLPDTQKLNWPNGEEYTDL